MYFLEKNIQYYRIVLAWHIAGKLISVCLRLYPQETKQNNTLSFWTMNYIYPLGWGKNYEKLVNRVIWR